MKLIKQDGIRPRHLESDINRRINSKKMVAITGARGCGKTTLAQKIAKERGMEFISLDDPTTCNQALRNPEGLLKSVDSTGAVIDEVQKAPELGEYLASYSRYHPRPHRFMMTSSIKSLVRLPVNQPSIFSAGNITRVELSTFSQAEIEGSSSPYGFLEDALEGNLSLDQSYEKSVDLWPRIWRGCYPAAVLAKNPKESLRWLKDYENLLKNRYMRESFNIRSYDKFNKFLQYLAENSGNWFHLRTIAKKLNVKTRTVDNWMFFLREAYIIDWSRNESMSNFRSSDPRNIYKGYKVYFLDSGLLASLRGWSSLEAILHPEHRLSMLKSFVYGELNKFTVRDGRISHVAGYEHSNGAKVEFLFQAASGTIGIDVKASPTLKSSDFEGLRCLKRQADEEPEFDEKIISGVIFYTGEETHCSDEGFYAFPVGMLWAYAREKSKEFPVLREAAMA